MIMWLTMRLGQADYDNSLVAVALICVVAATWKLRCQYLRGWRAKQLLEELDPMKDCHAINSRTLFVEFSFLYRCAFELGATRTAGVPRIIGLLLKAGLLRHVSKQYDDIDILVCEMLLHLHVDSPRGSLALRRLNFIPSCYPSIPNADYLYVLSLNVVTFVL